ncbi:PAS domain-containing sensor histidine kinase [Desulfotalea psychrophila]|nr:PAS domain-containing sensor histidine kinase [Desulfotalea psychrophila]
MTAIVSVRARFFTGSIGAVAVFLIAFLSFYYDSVQKNVAEINAHASVIANEVWAVDRGGVGGYLALISRLDSYRSISVVGPDGIVFASATGQPLSHWAEILFASHLLLVKEMRTEILHQGVPIGTLVAEKYIRILGPGFLIFLFSLILATIFVFAHDLVVTRRFLQKRLFFKMEKLDESERRFEELVNSLPEMVLETDLAGHIIYCNYIAESRFGLAGRDKALYFGLFIEEQREQLEERFRLALRGQDIGLRKLQAKDCDGRVFPLLVRCSPCYREGVAVGMRVLGIDISERVALRRRIEHGRRMEELGLMTGGAAHELKNILSGVVGYSDLLLIELASDAKERSVVAAIKTAGLQAANLVSDLLTVVRGGGGLFRQNRDINIILGEYFSSAECLRLRDGNSHVHYSLQLAREPLWISCSEEHILKIVMNLLVNATEAIEGTGAVQIKTSIEECTQPFFCQNMSMAEGTYVCLQVQDDGILDESRRHIFEPFYSKRVQGKNGTGLGMALVWSVVADHDAGIRISRADLGGKIEVFFPLVVAGTGDTSLIMGTDAEPSCGNGEVILVVDDEIGQCELAMKMLSFLNYSVHCATSSEQALSCLDRHRVDLLLLDMGPGIDGREICARVFANSPEQKTIITTGHGGIDDMEDLQGLEISGVVGKPYSVGNMASVVSAALASCRNE